MIIAIHNRSKKAYYGQTKSALAAQIGVTPQTLTNWMNKGNQETYNNYTVYFDCTELKCKKGFILNYENIFTLNHT